MNKHDWIEGLQNEDRRGPVVNVEGEIVYTVFMKDFLRMPDVDFLAVAQVDPGIRSLLN